MEKRLLIIINLALYTIISFFMSEETVIRIAIINIIAVLVITIIDCIFIYASYHIDIEKRLLKERVVKTASAILILISMALIGLTIISFIESDKYDLSISISSHKTSGFFTEIILGVVSIYQIHKTTEWFSYSIGANDRTEWFYEDEDNQEEK